MNKVLVIVHGEASNPGRLGSALRQRGFELDIRCPRFNHALPERLDDYAAVVVLGGPMGANDEDHYPFIKTELDWLDVPLKAGLPFLGVCLGAQLLAKSLGAPVTAHPEGLVEVGYYPVRATDAGRDLFADEMWAYHWHGDGFALPSDAVLLAEGDIFHNQAYRYGERAYGIQFHPEVTEQIMLTWLQSGSPRLDQPGALEPDFHVAMRRQYDAELSDWLDRFLDHWLRGATMPHSTN